MSKLAVLILTYNEEANIRPCIESVLFADEIVLIDSGSTDGTKAIAESMGATVVYHSMEEGFAAQRNFALSQTEAEWVLFLDADERITRDLAEEIAEVINGKKEHAYQILRCNVVFGQPVQHGGHSPDLSLRLYPREAITWQGVVHEKATVSLPIKQLKYPMLHHTYTSWERYFFKFNQYTTLMARQMHEKGKKMHLSDVLLRPWFAFFRFYILKAGWRDGRIGLYLALLHSFYTMTKYMKLYYFQKEGPTE